MELKEGMYVRTKDGRISKITFIHNGLYTLDNYEYEYSKQWLIKSSYNIIDLIEVGDYVNGMEVTNIGGTYYGRKDKAIYCEHNGNEDWKQVMIYDDEIKSIVTKEMFHNAEYRVETN